MSFFSPKELPKSTQDELEARASINFSNPWFSSRMPWIHVMSLAANCQTGDQQGKGVFTTKVANKTYSVTLEDGTTVSAPGYIVSETGRPGPAIMGIDVKKQGELGSTKRATIKIQAFTNDQFNEIAKCFFIPGMSVRAQWGWSVSAKGDKGVSPITQPLLDTEAIKQMLELQKVYPNYDGIQGRVVTYGANLADNNVWEITIDIIAAGSMIADMKANDYSDGCVCTQEVPVAGDQTKKEEVSKKTSNLDAALLNLAKQESTFAELQKLYGRMANYFVYIYYGYSVDESGAEDTSNTFFIFDSADIQYESYITIEFLQQIVTIQSQIASSGKRVFKFDSANSNLTQPIGKENGPKQIFCCDPRVGYIPGGTEFELTNIPGLGGSASVPAPSAYNADGTIALNKILINIKYARKVLLAMQEGSDSILDYMSKLLEDLNHACGNPWEFAYIDNTNDLLDDSSTVQKLNDAGTTIAIVDTKALTKQPPKPYMFHATPAKSNVLNVGIEFKVTEAMKTQALYSGTTPGATKQPCNDRFNSFQQFSGVNLGIPPKDENPKKKNCGSSGTSCDDSKKESETYAKRLDALKKKVQGTTVDAVYGDLVELNTTKNADNPCAGSILPVEFTIRLDGIGGVKFGQLITCDKFPEGYNNIMHHQVVGVEHQIDNNGWVTSIKTVGRYKS